MYHCNGLYINFHMLTVTNMAIMRNFAVMSDKFNVFRICTCGNYSHKWITVDIMYETVSDQKSRRR